MSVDADGHIRFAMRAACHARCALDAMPLMMIAAAMMLTMPLIDDASELPLRCFDAATLYFRALRRASQVVAASFARQHGTFRRLLSSFRLFSRRYAAMPLRSSSPPVSFRLSPCLHYYTGEIEIAPRLLRARHIIFSIDGRRHAAADVLPRLCAATPVIFSTPQL